MRQLSRRAALALGAAGAALGFVGSGRPASAAAKEAADQIAQFTGGKTAEKGKVSIELPEIAENGNTVPLSVAVDAPMDTDNYVSDILGLADGNPNPGVATFHFSPMSGKAAGVHAYPPRCDPEYHCGREDEQRRILHQPEAGEGHYRRLRRLIGKLKGTGATPWRKNHASSFRQKPKRAT